MNKKTIISLAISVVMIGSMFSANAQITNKKVRKARAHVKDAKQELADAKKDSVLEYKQFKTEAELMIAANESKIAELKAKKASDKKEINDTYNKRVADIEQRNIDLANKVHNYKADGNMNWMVFKTQFHAEVKRLNKQFQDSRDK